MFVEIAAAAMRGAPAAERLRSLLSASLGSFDPRSLLAAAGPTGSKAETLEAWLARSIPIGARCNQRGNQHAAEETA